MSRNNWEPAPAPTAQCDRHPETPVVTDHRCSSLPFKASAWRLTQHHCGEPTCDTHLGWHFVQDADYSASGPGKCDAPQVEHRIRIAELRSDATTETVMLSLLACFPAMIAIAIGIFHGFNTFTGIFIAITTAILLWAGFKYRRRMDSINRDEQSRADQHPSCNN